MRPTLFVVAVCVCVVIAGLTAQSPAPTTYWPGVEWRTATPESQGLDSQALASAIAQVREKQWGTQSLLVIRHGFVVADADFYPYRSTVPHDVASGTKTITSALTGVAVANRILRLDQPVLSFFPKESAADADERKRAITVENLLRMESGLDCGFLAGEQELERMKRSANWVAFTLALPMKYDRGTRPAYCSPGYHVLGSVIGRRRRPASSTSAASTCSIRSTSRRRSSRTSITTRWRSSFCRIARSRSAPTRRRD